MKTHLFVLAAMAALATAVASVSAMPAAGDGGAPEFELRPDASAVEIVQIYGLQASFLRAASTKDLGLMMSLWADDATFAVGGQIYRGKAQIRGWFANVAGAFQPQNTWVLLTPAQKIRITVRDNEASLYFEGYYVDVRTGEVRSQVTADTTLVRSASRWVIKDLKAGPADLAALAASR